MSVGRLAAYLLNHGRFDPEDVRVHSNNKFVKLDSLWRQRVRFMSMSMDAFQNILLSERRRDGTKRFGLYVQSFPFPRDHTNHQVTWICCLGTADLDCCPELRTGSICRTDSCRSVCEMIV